MVVSQCDARITQSIQWSWLSTGPQTNQGKALLIVTATTASVLGLLLAKLSLNVIGQRRKLSVGMGDGGHEALTRAIRAQANLAEYAPIALILLACLELNEGPMWLTVTLASLLVLGRLLHPVGIKTAEAAWQASGAASTAGRGPSVCGKSVLCLKVWR